MADEPFDWSWDEEGAEPSEASWMRVALALGIVLAVAGLVLATSAVSDALVR
jgi:hypothetical protein